MSLFIERRFQSEDGLQLYCRDYGSQHGGIPILCLAGISRNSRDFEDIAAVLSSRYRVFAMDLRGRGFSDRDPEWRNYHPQTYADDVLHWLDACDIDKVLLFGTSLGGLVSMLLTHQRADRVAGVILNDVGPEIAPAGLERIKSYLGRLEPVANWDEAVAQAKAVNGIAWPNLPDAEWRRITPRFYREDASGVPVLDVDPMVGEAARTVGAALTDPWELFDGLAGTPALLLHGELSDILSDDIVARMRVRKPDLEYLRVPGVGHVPLLNEPECVAAIESFIARVQENDHA